MGFDDTRWSLVLRAGIGGEGARDALEALCKQYWPPLYAFLLAKGNSPEDASDILQGFFVHVLEKNAINFADPEVGRFRTYLLTILTRFAGNQWVKSQAIKRGGQTTIVSIDSEATEALQGQIAVKTQSPEEIYERQWAMNVLNQSLDRLECAYRKTGKHALFDALRPALIAGAERKLNDEVASNLGMTPGAVRVAVHRLKTRFRETLLEVVADTVGSEQNVESELYALFEILGRR